MADKVIWYCHHYAGAPSKGMSYRPYYLTKEFSRAGYRAFIIGASNHHLLHSAFEQQQPVELRQVDDVNFVTLKTPAYRGNGLKRILNMLHYAFRFRKNHKEIVDITGKPDMIIVSSAHPFHYRALEKLSRKYKAKLVFEVRDLWPLSLIEIMNLKKWHPLVLWLSSIEKRAYRRSDYVVSVLEKALDYMKLHGLSDEKKFRYIPNGVSAEDFQATEPLDKKIAETIGKLKENKFLVGYAGAMGKPNALIYLIKAMELLQEKRPDIHCVMVGEGSLKTDLLKYIEDKQLQNVTIFDRIPKKQVPEFLKMMDVLYLGWNHTATAYQYGVSPNKIFDYLMSAVPVIESGGTEDSLIRRQGCGISVAAESPVEIAGAIEDMMDKTPFELNEFQEKARSIINHFDYRALSKKYPMPENESTGSLS